MAEVAISKEKLDYTIDLLITMTVEEIAEDTGKGLCPYSQTPRSYTYNIIRC